MQLWSASHRWLWAAPATPAILECPASFKPLLPLWRSGSGECPAAASSCGVRQSPIAAELRLYMDVLAGLLCGLGNGTASQKEKGTIQR